MTIKTETIVVVALSRFWLENVICNVRGPVRARIIVNMNSNETWTNT